MLVPPLANMDLVPLIPTCRKLVFDLTGERAHVRPQETRENTPRM